MTKTLPTRSLILYFAATLLAGCGQATDQSTSSHLESSQGDTSRDWVSVPSDAGVAKSDHAEVTASELDRHILSMSATQRSNRGDDPKTWYQEQARELIAEKILYAQALEAGLADDSAYFTARSEAQRDAVLAMCLQAQTYADPRVTEDMLRETYDDDLTVYQRPETRLTYHIFLYANDQRPASQVQQQLDALRQRVESGENFRVLAQQVSESSSRHAKAELGWLKREEVSVELGDAIFSAKEDIPIGPIMTAEGGHLFWVDMIKPAATLSFEAIRNQLVPIVTSRHIEDILKHLGADIASNWEIADTTSVQNALAQNNSEFVVFSNGDYVVRLTDLRTRLNRHPATTDPRVLISAELDRLDVREAAYQACMNKGLYDPEQLPEQLAQWSRSFLVAKYRAQNLTALAVANEERLREFYDNNQGFFSTPVRWQLKLYTAPFSRDASEHFQTLEHAESMSDQQLSDQFQAWGGETRTAQWFGKAALDRIGRNAAQIIAPLQIDQRSAPFRIGTDGIAIAQVVDKEAGRAPPFEQVKQRVADHYRRQYTAELYEQMINTLLATENVTYNDQTLEAFASGAVVDTNISSESLESMLRELEDAR